MLSRIIRAFDYETLTCRNRVAGGRPGWMFARAHGGCLRSFLPTWIFCIAGAILLTLVVRFVLVRAGLDRELGPRIIVYPSMVTLLACAIWLFGFHD